MDKIGTRSGSPVNKQTSDAWIVQTLHTHEINSIWNVEDKQKHSYHFFPALGLRYLNLCRLGHIIHRKIVQVSQGYGHTAHTAHTVTIQNC